MRIKLVLVVSLFLLFPALVAMGDEIQIADQWVAEPPPGAKMLGGYMIITNTSGKDVRLIEVSGADFGKVEMHKTIIENDKAQMVKQEYLKIGAGAQLVLKPGSYHLMLMMPKRALKEGDMTQLHFIFDSGAEISLQAEVRKKETMK